MGFQEQDVRTWRMRSGELGKWGVSLKETKADNTPNSAGVLEQSSAPHQTPETSCLTAEHSPAWPGQEGTLSLGAHISARCFPFKDSEMVVSAYFYYLPASNSILPQGHCITVDDFAALCSVKVALDSSVSFPLSKDTNSRCHEATNSQASSPSVWVGSLPNKWHALFCFFFFFYMCVCILSRVSCHTL